MFQSLRAQMLKKISRVMLLFRPFRGSAAYWEKRYAAGGTSGRRSQGELALFKANFVNGFVEVRRIQSIIEFGCGDGQQLEIMKYPEYCGFDVSASVIRIASARFSQDSRKCFKMLSDYNGEQADLVISLDVIYHLVEDDIFARHVSLVFKAAKRYVIFYSSDPAEDVKYEGGHVRHRALSKWISSNPPEGWFLLGRVPNPMASHPAYLGSMSADFLVYGRDAGEVLSR
jgi:SAM-dependent methyltransferase